MKYAASTDARRDAERDAPDRQRRPPAEPPDGDADGHDPDAAGEHPDRRRPERVAGGLEPDVPGQVQDRGDGDERDDPGIHPRTLPAHIAPRDAPRAEGQAADGENRGDGQPHRIEDAGHRLAEMCEQGQLEDRIGQLERRPERIDQERRDHEAGGDGRRQRRSDETADGEPDTGERGRRQAEHGRPEERRDQVTADDQDRGSNEDGQDEGRDGDPGQHPGATVERPTGS